MNKQRTGGSRSNRKRADGSGFEDFLELCSALDELSRKNAGEKRGKRAKRGRPAKNSCRALIPLDTERIRREHLKKYRRRKKTLERLEAQIQQHEEQDEPAFQKYLARTFGVEQTRQRELAEQIHLYQTRYQKICFMADEHGMPRGRYCFSLRKKVTAEMDFWSVLEAEIQEFMESVQKKREAEAQAQRNAGGAVHRDFSDFGDEDDDGWPGDEDDDEYACGPDEFFKKLLGDIFGMDDDSPGNAAEAGELKKLYRELCMRYHPDRIGAHDAQMQRLWIEIQNAYGNEDLSRLRAIRSEADLKSGRTDLSCSEIDDMISEIEFALMEKRDELHEHKRTPSWGFAASSERQRTGLARAIKAKFALEERRGEAFLQKVKRQVELLLQWRPKEDNRGKRRTRLPEYIEEELPF